MTKRREVIKSLAAGSLALTGVSAMAGCETSKKNMNAPVAPLKNNIRHSVAKWTYDFIPLEDLCKVVKETGFTAIDLLTPAEWPVVKKYDLHCSMCYTAGKISLTQGWNRIENHGWLIKDFTEAIPLVAAAGYTNLICFSGNRDGMDDATGLKNCATGLKQIMSLAEKNNVIVQMELFNSKVDHKDYMCDKSAWGVELCKQIGSPNFKLLYDIYHMQINEGDVIRTIRDNHAYFGHYHTAGVPGRHEINDTQELYYPAIMQAILDTGYKGHVAQEFIPSGKTTEEKIAALKDAVRRCDV